MSAQTRIIFRKMDNEVSRPAVLGGSDETANQSYHSFNISAYNEEIEDNLEKFKAKGLNGPAVNATTFPLPTLGPHLKAVAHNIHEGTGFSLLRGFNTQKYTDEDNLIIFLGLGSHIGSQRGKSRPVFRHLRWIGG